MLFASCDEAGAVVLWHFRSPVTYDTFVIEDGSRPSSDNTNASAGSDPIPSHNNLPGGSSSATGSNKSTHASVEFVTDGVKAEKSSSSSWSVLCFSPDGGLLACGGLRQRKPAGDVVGAVLQERRRLHGIDQGVIKLYTTSDMSLPGEEICLLSIDGESAVHPWAVTCMAWGPPTTANPKGLLAFGDAGGSLRIWDPEIRRVVKEIFVTPGRALTLIAWSHGGSKLAAGHSTFKEDGRPSSLFRVYRDDSDYGEPSARWVEAKMLMPDMYVCAANGREDTLFLSGYRDHKTGPQVVLLDTTTGWEKVLEQPGSVAKDDETTDLKLRRICWSPCGKMLLNEAGNLWDVTSGRLKGTVGPCKSGFRQHTLSSMSWSPNGRFLMTSPVDAAEHLTLWSMDESESQQKYRMSFGGSSDSGPLNRPGQNRAHSKLGCITSVAWSPAAELIPEQQDWLLNYKSMHLSESAPERQVAEAIGSQTPAKAPSADDKEPLDANAETPQPARRAPPTPGTRPKGEKSKVEKEIHKDGSGSLVVREFYNLIPQNCSSLADDEVELESLLQFFGAEHKKSSVRSLQTRQKIREVFEKALGAPLKDGERPELSSDGDAQCKDRVKRFIKKEFTAWKRALLFAYLLIKRLQDRSRRKGQREERRKLQPDAEAGDPAESSRAAAASATTLSGAHGNLDDVPEGQAPEELADDEQMRIDDNGSTQNSLLDVPLGVRKAELKRPRSPSSAISSDITSSNAKMQRGFSNEPGMTSFRPATTDASEKSAATGTPSEVNVAASDSAQGCQDPADDVPADSDVEEDAEDMMERTGSVANVGGLSRVDTDNTHSLQISLPESMPLEEDIPMDTQDGVREHTPGPAAPPAPAVYPKQEQVASELLAKVQQQEEAQGKAFNHFAFFIQVPNLNSLLGQTITRVNEFLETHRREHPGFFSGIDATDIVYKGAKSTTWCAMFEQIKERILNEPKTMFLFVHDEAHWSPTPGTSGWFINDELLRTSPNVFTLFVSATPYNLLTRDSQIPIENEHHWFTSNEETNYYGLQKYCANLAIDGGCLPGAIVQDKRLAASANAVQLTDTLRETFMTSRQTADGGAETQKALRLKIKTLVALEMHYMAAFLQAMGREPSKEAGVRQPNGKPLPTLPESDLTLQMVRKLVRPGSSDGRGVMILVRVADQKSGKSLYNSLRSMRAYLGLQNTLGVIIDINQAEARDDTSFGLKETIEQPLLDKLLSWQRERGWVPPDATAPLVRQYSDLEDLPCVLILCEKGKMGDTFPKSLRYYDLRLRYISSCNERAATEQDLGRAFRYVSDSDPELPTILASVKLHQDLQAKRGGRVGLLKHDPSRPDLMRCVRRGRGKECYPDITLDHPEGDTSPYRQHWSAGRKHFDHGMQASSNGASTSQAWVHNPRRFALVAAPQIGKTGAFLHLVYLLWSKHAPAPGVPIPPAVTPLQPKAQPDEVDLEPKTEEDDDEELLELDDEDELPEVVVPLRGLSHNQVGRLVEHALNEEWGKDQQRLAHHLAGQRVADAGVDGTVLAEENQDLVDELKSLLIGQARREVLAAAVSAFKIQGVPQRLIMAWAEAPTDEPLPLP